MRAAIRFAQCNGYFGYRGFTVGIEQFGTVPDDGVVFLSRTGQEAGNVDQGDDGNVEGVAEAHKTGAFARSVTVEHPGHLARLVGHDTYRLTVEAGKADNQVAGEIAVHFEELALVDDGTDDFIHVIGFVG